MRTKKTKGSCKAIITSIIIGIIVIYCVFNFMPVVVRDSNIVVERGDGAIKICRKLGEVKIRHKTFICMCLRIHSAATKNKITVGEYELEKNATINQVIQDLTKEKIHKITFPEGLTKYEIIQILEADKNTVGNIPSDIPEGSLMPDTYFFAKGTGKNDIINMMIKEMEDFMLKQWPRRDMSIALQKPSDAIIMASIIENETSIDAEKPLIASTFYNRMQKQMRIQSCATVIYCLTGGKASTKLRRKLSWDDLWVKCKHNTYRNAGLPPTAISSPSRASILSVLHPAKTNYLYFVAEEGSGHTFTAKFSDHVVSKFQNRKKPPVILNKK